MKSFKPKYVMLGIILYQIIPLWVETMYFQFYDYIEVSAYLTFGL